MTVPNKRRKTGARAEGASRTVIVKDAAEHRLAELTAIIRFDPRTLFNADGVVKRLQELPDEVRMALDEVEIEPISGRIRRVTFKNKIDAAEEFLRICGRDKEPEMIALLKSARSAQLRNAEVLKAMEGMRGDEIPPGRVN